MTEQLTVSLFKVFYKDENVKGKRSLIKNNFRGRTHRIL